MDFQHCGEFFMLKKNSGRKNYNYTHNHNFLTFFACDIFAWKTARPVFKANYQNYSQSAAYCICRYGRGFIVTDWEFETEQRNTKLTKRKNMAGFFCSFKDKAYPCLKITIKNRHLGVRVSFNRS